MVAVTCYLSLSSWRVRVGEDVGGGTPAVNRKPAVVDVVVAVGLVETAAEGSVSLAEAVDALVQHR